MSGHHPSRCGGCGRAVEPPTGWLCASCSTAWDTAIEVQTNPTGAADRLERTRIDAYLDRRR